MEVWRKTKGYAVKKEQKKKNIKKEKNEETGWMNKVPKIKVPIEYYQTTEILSRDDKTIENRTEKKEGLNEYKTK